jgi:hypothetical protein
MFHDTPRLINLKTVVADTACFACEHSYARVAGLHTGRARIQYGEGNVRPRHYISRITATQRPRDRTLRSKSHIGSIYMEIQELLSVPGCCAMFSATDIGRIVPDRVSGDGWK